MRGAGGAAGTTQICFSAGGIHRLEGRRSPQLVHPVPGLTFPSSPRCCSRPGTMPSPLSCSQHLAHSRSSRIACRMEGQLSWQVGSNDAMRGCTGLVTQLLHAHLLVTLPSDTSLPRNTCHKVLLRLSRLLNMSIAAAGPETHLTQLVGVTWEGCARWAPSNLRAPQSGCYSIQ